MYFDLRSEEEGLLPPKQLSEQSYLTAYNPKDFPVVLVTVDSVLMTFHEAQLKILLVRRKNPPYAGQWGLPGGFLDQRKDLSLVDAAVRSVRNKTAIEPRYLEQIETVGSSERDPRGWSVSVLFSALMPFIELDTDADSAWMSVESLHEYDLAFDHLSLIKKALARYKQKALYSFVPVFAISQPFTLTELRKVHEAFIGQSVQRKSFSRRVDASQMFIDTGEVQVERGRPAALYNVKPAITGYRFVRNLEAE